MKRYALKDLSTGKFLGMQVGYGKRTWTDLSAAQLWTGVGPAVLAAKHQLRKRGNTGNLRAYHLLREGGAGGIQMIEFEMILIDPSIGFISKQQLEEQHVEIENRKESAGP